MSEQPGYGWGPTGGQPPGHGQPEYGQPQYAHPQYGQPQYGQPQYAPHGQYPPVAPPQPQEGLSRGGVAWLVAAGAVALIAVVATVVVLLTRDGDRSPAAAQNPLATSPETDFGPAPPAPVAPEPAAEPGSAAAPIALGQAAPVGDYVVTVTGVITDGDAIVAEANQFNDAPDGRYVIVELTAQYTGGSEGNPYWDLSYVFNGTDARQYDDSQCSAVLPNDAIDAPTLNPSGSASFQVCMDVPPTAIDGGVLFVEPLISFDAGERVFFAIR